jgi:hypothetical protein
MKLEFSTPALMFPAISLLMLAYTNRFLALATLIRKLHEQYNKNDNGNSILASQILSLRRRIHMIRQMQTFGLVCFIFCVLTMYFIYLELFKVAHILFAISLISFMISLVISFIEIQLSTKALEMELSDMEEKSKGGIINFIKDNLS